MLITIAKKIPLLVCLLCLCSAAPAKTKVEDQIFNIDNPQSVIAQMKPISPETFATLQAIDPIVIETGVAREHILLVNLALARQALNLMVQANWGSMDFLANPFFNESPFVFYFPHESLSSMYQEYEISSPFFPSGKTRRQNRSGKEMIPINSGFEIQGILIGRARIVVLYPFHISVHRDDDFYGFLTGNYELYRVNVTDIQNNSQRTYSLSHLRGRDDPKEGLSPVRGPLHAPFNLLSLSPDHQTVTVHAGATVWKFKHPLFKKIIPFKRTEPLQAQDNKRQ